MTPRPTVWLIAAPGQLQWANPDLLTPYGNVRTIFKAREVAWESPERTFARLVEAFDEFKPGDFVTWMGGDALLLLMAGAALTSVGVNEWTWLRYVGREEYQEIPIQFDRISTTQRDPIL